jgi:hypothetical protein
MTLEWLLPAQTISCLELWIALLRLIFRVAGLAISLAVLVIAGVRRSGANRGNPDWFRRPGGQPGHQTSIRGDMPNTPLPEWIDWDDDKPDPDPGQRDH